MQHHHVKTTQSDVFHRIFKLVNSLFFFIHKRSFCDELKYTFTPGHSVSLYMAFDLTKSSNLDSAPVYRIILYQFILDKFVGECRLLKQE